METKLRDFEALSLRLASPDKILSWSHGEVTKPETINYRTIRAERDGLFDERIFGPAKDWECYCGKYRRIRYKGIVCDKCGVEVTRAIVRRERMGHIKLATPVSHIWFLRGVPSKIGIILDMSVSDLEKVIYFAGYVVTYVDEKARAEALGEIDREFKVKSKKADKNELLRLKEARDRAREELRSLTTLAVISEVEYHRLSLKYGNVFSAEIGAEAIRRFLERANLPELEKRLIAELETATPIARKKALKRLKVIRGMIKSGLRPEWMFLTVIPVIPPDLRPMVQLDGGRFASSDLNDLYRRVINRNNRLKRLFELKAPEVITRNEKRMLQEAVDALIDNSIRRGSQPVASQIQRRPLRSLADMLKGKQGRFRQNLLGKRVDYSGRSVIVVGPSLKMHQCGLPKKMALELFKPFVIRRLLELEIAHNIKGAGKLIEERPPEVWAILEEVIEGKFVLLNRAPTLHRLGIQAFQPILIEGDAIQIHPLVCRAFNADFDGDQMAVHVPLSDEAQTEAREIMLSTKNLLKPATGAPIVHHDKDMVLGCYWATLIEEDATGAGRIFSSKHEAMLAYEFGVVGMGAEIKVLLPVEKIYGYAVDRKKIKKEEELIETSVGRLLFNDVLPNDFPYVNQEMTSKGLEGVVAKIIKHYGVMGAPEILDHIKDFGFEYATRSGISWGMDALRVPELKKELIKKADQEVGVIYEHYQSGLLTDRERYERVVEVWREVMDKIKAAVPGTLDPKSGASMMIQSKARGTVEQLNQMSGMKGLVKNPSGRIIELPVISSYKEGLNVLEYFISTHGARKGTADTALRTAHAGYLTRRLVDVSQDVVITEEDCRTKRGLKILRTDSEEINRPLGQRIFSRVLLEDAKDAGGKVVAKAGAYIDEDAARFIETANVEAVSVRSAITCRSIKGICQKCYGYDLGKNAPIALGEAVGIVAAQAIGEPGTQLTMRTFHVGGVVGTGDITLGLPRVDEVFEARTPHGRAMVSDVSGLIEDITEVSRERVIRVGIIPDTDVGKKKTRKVKATAPEDVKEFRVPSNISLLVKKGETIRAGQILTEGHADLKELFKYAGVEEAQNYILKEIQMIYSLQGAPIHDKHIEVIVRQMFSRVRIKNTGDAEFTIGEVVEKNRFRAENRRVEKLGKSPATAVQLLLGITKVALTTESFLSAASFQETTRVLINAAVEGKRDVLRGLKENVIIGRLIPAGTGYHKSIEKHLTRATAITREVSLPK
ncbi:MAG: DNA-directed RNA polymerase subunit beta' [Candidatus Sungbacteria bacterium RIFCSPLOWO2_02_FULL_48_13b]|uniref:DNA-directed RNA polymerase subunit beta' n=2 Tax=Candidatus Sungiibacteriota TaxID=1817917 RepID=A0A1G2LF04_9BACT|nr:MAG: DNA-directed RNA polymerase subunit beta' [Candidatus Sungbacteria bacterium RIFCSPHIGHO2_02_FULL_49_20]OHA10186.1 MAG: DNA-directed RNA polymerase subunit beta' [Candidatus Sungbacteria bacterium RIFCSPLOWO2_02_FULL_48_13b]